MPQTTQPGGVGSLEAGRVDSPERVAKVIGDGEDVVEHRVGRPAPGPASRAGTLSFGRSRPGGADSTRAGGEDRAPEPGARPGDATVEQDGFADLGPRLDATAGADHRPRADRGARRRPPRPGSTRTPGPVGSTSVSTAPSRMSQVACR